MEAHREFADGVDRARRAAASLSRALASEEKKSRAAVGQRGLELAEAKSEAARRKLPPAWLAGGKADGPWGTFVGGAWRRARSKDIAASDAAAAQSDRLLQSEKRLWLRRKAERDRFAAVARSLGETAKILSRFGPMPDGLRHKARPHILKARGLRNRARRDMDSLVAVAAGLIAVAAEWAEAERASALAAPAQAEAVPDANPPAAVAAGRIYLPIPHALGTYAKAAGARFDSEAPRGSKWYVPAGEPLGRFRSFLPLAFREKPPKLSFPPVRHGASSQNLWSLFDQMTWNNIRHINYERTGRRCVLCGKQSGNLLRHLEADGDRGMGTVDCHEVWEWTVPDPSVDIGIQKLKGMLVVCFECHMIFHDGFARSRAKAKGIEDEVRRFLMKRRSFITRADPVDVANEMKAEAARLRKHAGVKAWIVDLSHLGRQDYMAQVNPVFVEDNVPGTKIGLMAGMSFVTDRGRSREAVPAAKVYASLADLYRHTTVREFTASRRALPEDGSMSPGLPISR